MIFRKAKKSEKQIILNLYESVKGTEFCFWDEQYPGKIEAEADLEAGTLYVLEQNGEIIGAASAVPENELDYFDCWQVRENAREFARVALAPAYMGRGLSKHLIACVLDEIKKSGAAAVHISVVTSNIPAVKLYRSSGFDFLGETDLYGLRFYLCEKKFT